MFNRKKKVVIGVSVLCLILILCIAGPYLAKNMYIHSIISPEKAVKSYDGKFAFLKMPTKKWYVQALNIYDASPAICKQQIETFYNDYNKFAMEDISWGNHSCDLFFLSAELGSHIYKYLPSGKWLGPLYFSEDATIEKRLSGDTESYCFDVGSEVNIEELSGYWYGDIIVIKKDTIPKSFLKRIDSLLSLE